MKKTIIMLFLILLFTLFQFADSKKVDNKTQKFNIQINGNYILFSDDDYKKVYSDATFFPELKIGYLIYKKIYVWTSFGILSATGDIEELDEEAKSNQTYMKLCIGYRGIIGKKLGYSMDIGGFLAKYKEEAFGEINSDSAIGFSTGISLNYNFTKRLYFVLGLSYMTAKDSIADKSFKIGGINSFIGIGFRF